MAVRPCGRGGEGQALLQVYGLQPGLAGPIRMRGANPRGKRPGPGICRLRQAGRIQVRRRICHP